MYVAASDGIHACTLTDSHPAPVPGAGPIGSPALFLAIDPAGRFAYAVNDGSNSVSSFTIQPDGSVSPTLPIHTVDTGSAPSSVTVDPSGRFVYVADHGAGKVLVYSIGAGGVLSAVGDPVTTGPASGVAIDPSGRLAYIQLDSAVAAFPIDPVSGALGVKIGDFPAGIGLPGVNSVAVDPTGKFVYASGVNSVVTFAVDSVSGALTLASRVRDRGSVAMAMTKGTSPVVYAPEFVYVAADSAAASGTGGISAFKVNSDGTLAPNGSDPSVQPMNPRSIAVGASGRFLYELASLGVQFSLPVFAIGRVAGTEGRLSGVQDPNGTATGSNPTSIAVDPSGRFAYVTDAAATDVYSYSIGVNGLLDDHSLNPLSTGGTNPVSVVVDPSGSFAYVANAGSNNVSAFSIGPAGVLTPNGTIAAGDLPDCVTVDPSGQFVYVTNEAGGPGSISAYTISLFGTLSPLTSLPFTGDLQNPRCVAIDPASKFAYVAGFQSVWVFKIRQDGSLGDASLALQTAGFSSVNTDPSGRFVYVTDSGSISAFSIDSTTGHLNPLGTTPLIKGTGFVFGIAITSVLQ